MADSYEGSHATGARAAQCQPDVLLPRSARGQGIHEGAARAALASALPARVREGNLSEAQEWERAARAALYPERRRPGELRTSDAERDTVIARLREHSIAGRLDVSELEERLSLALAARTRAELAALERDLPELRQDHQGGDASAPRLPARLGLRPVSHRKRASGGRMRGYLAPVICSLAGVTTSALLVGMPSTIAYLRLAKEYALLYLLGLIIWGVAALVSLGVLELVGYSKRSRRNDVATMRKSRAATALTIAIAAPVCGWLAARGYVR